MYAYYVGRVSLLNSILYSHRATYLYIYRSRKRNHWVFSVPLLCKMNSTTVRDLYSQFLKISTFQSWFEFSSLRLQLFSFVREVNPAFTFYFVVTMHLSFCLFGAFDDKL